MTIVYGIVSSGLQRIQNCNRTYVDIYKKAPIELNAEHEDKDEDWHFKRVILKILSQKSH